MFSCCPYFLSFIYFNLAVIYKVIRNRCEDGRRHFKNRVKKRQNSFEEVVGTTIGLLSAEDLVKGLGFRKKTCNNLSTSSVNILSAEIGSLRNVGLGKKIPSSLCCIMYYYHSFTFRWLWRSRSAKQQSGSRVARKAVGTEQI